MSKPEDIPQDVERKAFKIALEFRKSELEDGVQALALTHVIARAIMAEREACAETGRAEVMKFRTAMRKRYYPGYHEDMREAIAAAIRNRSDVNTTHKTNQGN